MSKVLLELFRLLAVCLCGLSIGWLVGLSESPIIQTLISSILTLVVGAISVIVGLKKVEDRESRIIRLSQNVNLIPICALVFTIATGASIGVYARTHNWLGKKNYEIISEWKSLGYDSVTVAKRLFDNEFAWNKAKITSIQTPKVDKTDGVLYSLSTKSCDFIKNGLESVPMKSRLLAEMAGTADSLEIEFIKLLNDEQIKKYVQSRCSN